MSSIEEKTPPGNLPCSARAHKEEEEEKSNTTTQRVEACGPVEDEVVQGFAASSSSNHGIKRPADEVILSTERPKKQVKFDPVSICLKPTTEVWNWTRALPATWSRDGPAPVDPTILSPSRRQKANELIQVFKNELDTDNDLFTIEIQDKKVICKDMRMIRGLEHACENANWVEFSDDNKLSIGMDILPKLTADTTVSEFQELVSAYLADSKPRGNQSPFQIYYGGRCGWHVLLCAVEEGNKELVKYALDLAGCDANKTRLVHLFLMYCFVNSTHNVSPWRVAVAAAVNEPENQTRQDILAMLEPYSY